MQSIHIMGILNLTPDSFYAGSRVAGADALSRARRMWADGADVVDLGACSTRPGAPQPSLEEEWARLEPVLLEMAGYALPGDSGPLPLSGGGQAPGRASLPPIRTRHKNIAILLIIKGIAIAFVNLFDYICVALK